MSVWGTISRWYSPGQMWSRRFQDCSGRSWGMEWQNGRGKYCFLVKVLISSHLLHRSNWYKESSWKILKPTHCLQTLHSYECFMCHCWSSSLFVAVVHWYRWGGDHCPWLWRRHCEVFKQQGLPSQSSNANQGKTYCHTTTNPRSQWGSLVGAFSWWNDYHQSTKLYQNNWKVGTSNFFEICTCLKRVPWDWNVAKFNEVWCIQELTIIHKWIFSCLQTCSVLGPRHRLFVIITSIMQKQQISKIFLV